MIEFQRQRRTPVIFPRPDRAPARSLSPAQQQPLGNQVAQRFAQSCPLRLPSPSVCPFGGACHACPVQAKLTVNEPGDKYEQEADQVADQVMHMPEPRTVQRACATCDEEKALQLKPLTEKITPLVQRQVEPEEEEEEEEPIQAQLAEGTQIQRQEEEVEEEEESIQTKPDGEHTPRSAPDLDAQIRSLKGSGRPLPRSERDFFEPRFGRDLSQVRLHTGPQAAETAQAVGARAFTLGHDVVFGAGQYTPGTVVGDRLLAHELTHVVQQRGNDLQQDTLDGTVHTVRQKVAYGRIQRLPINQAVTEFKNKVNNPELLKRGQFYWAAKLWSTIKTKYQGILNASWTDPDKTTMKTKLDDLLDTCYLPRRKYATISTKRRDISQFLTASSNPTASTLKSMLGRGTHRTKDEGTKVFRVLWKEYKITGTLPDLTRYATFSRLEGLRRFEYIACWAVGQRMPDFVMARGGFSVGSRSASKAIKGISLCRRTRRDMTEVAGYKRGDVVIYKGLSSAIGKIKDAVDDGYFIHARVLSGLDSGATSKCKEEHSIDIIGCTGDKFVFWDPDAAVSHQFGGGFGFLYYDSAKKRFTTAQNDGDMPVDGSGDHSGGQHRYQVLRVWTK